MRPSRVHLPGCSSLLRAEHALNGTKGSAPPDEVLRLLLLARVAQIVVELRVQVWQTTVSAFRNAENAELTLTFDLFELATSAVRQSFVLLAVGAHSVLTSLEIAHTARAMNGKRRIAAVVDAQAGIFRERVHGRVVVPAGGTDTSGVATCAALVVAQRAPVGIAALAAVVAAVPAVDVVSSLALAVVVAAAITAVVVVARE